MAPAMQKDTGGGPRHDDDPDRDRGGTAVSEQPGPATRAAAGPHESQTLKKAAYDECYDAIVAIWKDEGGNTLDDIALMATINSILSNRFSHYYWTGFYRVCGDRLVVGPYVGTVGCLQIAFGQGVCGTAASKRASIVVPDVNAFPGHIACDAASKSEVVVPVFAPDGELIAVFDVDSDQPDAFDEDDRAGLERIVELFRQA